MSVTSEMVRLQRQLPRRAKAWDATFELVRASVDAPDSDRFGLVTQRVVDGITTYLADVTDTDDELSDYVCRPGGPTELVVITLWEEGEDAAVPKRFTDALRRDDHRVI